MVEQYIVHKVKYVVMIGKGYGGWMVGCLVECIERVRMWIVKGANIKAFYTIHTFRFNYGVITKGKWWPHAFALVCGWYVFLRNEWSEAVFCIWAFFGTMNSTDCCLLVIECFLGKWKQFRFLLFS